MRSRRLVWVMLPAVLLAAAAAPAAEKGEAAPKEAEWEKALKAAFDKKISLDFVETPVQDVCAFISNLADVPIVLDPKALKDEQRNVTLRVNDMALKEAFNWVCKLVGLTCVARNGALFVTSAERAKEVAKEDKEGRVDLKIPEAVAKALAKKISFDFVETPIQDAVAFLRQQSGLELALDAEALGGNEPHNVTLRVNDMRLDWALGWICEVAGLAYVWDGGRFVVTTPKAAKKVIVLDPEPGSIAQPQDKELAAAMAKRVTFEFAETTLNEVAALLRKASGVKITLDPKLEKEEVLVPGVRAKEMRLDQALQRICRLSGVACLWKDGGALITTPEAARKEQGPDKR